MLLHSCVANGTPGHAAVVEVLLKEGHADACVLNHGGMPLIYKPAGHGCIDCVRMIVGHGADVNARTRVGEQTPLMVATSRGYT
eukprot:29689-Eustigmatos_ZCMA.PRE.1